ncbi:MAG: DUF3656 domain-containing U32 family peptidase [Bacillota bacterium]
MKNIELLAPAGSFEALVAAVESGADAVYMGGSRYNARAFAENFDDAALKKAVEYAHIRGTKVYVTLNILLNDEELQDVLEYVAFLYNIDVDAIIIQDVALINMIKRYFPDFDIHCSTQMTVHNAAGAAELASKGVKRIVLARELTLEEIRHISESTDAELEVFVHGALCICYSGQCLMSSMIGGRSGNRGRCAQPCRRKYSLYDLKRNKPLKTLGSKYIISTRDLCTYPRLDELLNTEVFSLKIEGRMKKPEYVAIVVQNYQSAISRYFEENRVERSKEAENELLSIFNREFTEGYLFNKRNKEIVSIDRPDNRGVYIGRVTGRKGNVVSIKLENNYLHDGDGIEIINGNGSSIGAVLSGLKVKGRTAAKAAKGDTVDVFIRDRGTDLGAVVNKTLDSELLKKAREEYYYENKKKINVRCSVELRIGSKPLVSLSDEDGFNVSCSGDEVIERAINVPTTQDKVRQQLDKTGDTPYVFSELSVHIDDNCNVPARVLNNLRREALGILTEKRAKRHHRKIVEPIIYESDKKLRRSQITENEIELIAGVRSAASAENAISAGADIIYILYDLNMSCAAVKNIIDNCRSKEISCYIVLPAITKDMELEHIEREILFKLETGDYGAVVSNIGQFKLAGKYFGNRVRLNYTFNVFNSKAVDFYKDYNIESICLSPELNIKQIKKIAYSTDVRCEAFTYGYLPVMTTEYCPMSSIDECRGCKNGSINMGLQDEKGKIFPILMEGFCRTKILNSDVLYMLEDTESLKASGLSFFRADFMLESDLEVFELVNAFKKAITKKEYTVSGVIKRIKERGYTKGHYFRGVE